MGTQLGKSADDRPAIQASTAADDRHSPGQVEELGGRSSVRWFHG
jgi:hypothetical protein